MPDNVIWSGPEHGDGETLAMAFRRITGRDFAPGRCMFEDVRGMESTYVFRDVEVTVRWDGSCTISRELPASVCSAHRVPEPGCPLCGVRWGGGGGGAG